MSTQFSTLMALSAMQTQQSQAAVQSTLAERKRKEEQRRKEQEAREQKQRELEVRLRLKHFEDEQRERQRLEQKEKQRAAKEAEKEKREAAQRDFLRYGPKKATHKSVSGGYPSVNAQTREELRKQRIPSDDEESGNILTREEKRQRRLHNDLLGSSRSTKRSGQTGGYQKSGKRLPGGALNVTGSSLRSLDTSQSVKARLSAMPNTLTRLNVVKRDTRTIDEIVRDREREKEGRVLNGDQAKDFHDWFGKEKKKDAGWSRKTGTVTPNSRSHSPASHTSATKSPTPNGATALLKKNVPKASSVLPAVNKNSAIEKGSTAKPNLKSPASDTNLKSSKPSVSKTPAKSKHASSSHNIHSSHPTASSAKKRPRSTSLSSDSSTPPPSRRRVAPEEDHLKSQIWKLFGKDRSTYVSNYVDSDDEDMEANASILEKEEMRSARIARKEDEAALRDEKMHEDEKRRKRMERKFSKLSQSE